MKKDNITFSEYMEDSKQLFIKLFGKDTFKKIQKIEFKPIDWKGLDVTTSSILATTPNVKERFNKDWVEYFKERDYTAFDIFLETVFHYGYQQCVDYEVEPNREWEKKLANIITQEFINKEENVEIKNAVPEGQTKE